MTKGGQIRILVVDDHEMVREGLMAMLQSEPDFDVVGQTGRGAEAVDLVEATRSDVVLLDARLPDVSGVEVCRRLTHAHPEVAVVILTTYTDPDLVQECIQAGARGYVVKDVERFSLKESIRAVYRGQSVLAPQVAGHAAEVHLSENTVKTHVQEIFRKLGVRNRVEAAILAGKSGWI